LWEKQRDFLLEFKDNIQGQNANVSRQEAYQESRKTFQV
jgi:hypothetical protein